MDLPLENSSPEMQATAARRLGRRRDATALRAALELAASPHASVRAAALWAADRMCEVSALPAFLAALHDPTFEVRSAAGWGLVHLGAASIGVVRRVAERTGNPAAAEMARLVLGRISDEDHEAWERRACRPETPSKTVDALAARVVVGAHDINGKLTVVAACVDWMNQEEERRGSDTFLAALASIAGAARRVAGHAQAVLTWAEDHGLQVVPTVFGRYGGRAVAEPGIVLFRELALDVNALQLGVAALLDRRGEHPAVWDDAPDVIVEATSGVVRLLRDVALRTTATDAPGPSTGPSAIDLPQVAARLGAALRVLCRRKGLRSGVACAEGARGVVYANERLLERVVDNLVTNAVKYTASGAVTVEFGRVDDVLTVRVSDTGRGIASEALARLFEPGASDRATRAPNSYGVGLSYVARVLDEAGGRIDVDSAVGAGSTFEVRLPVASEVM